MCIESRQSCWYRWVNAEFYLLFYQQHVEHFRFQLSVCLATSKFLVSVLKAWEKCGCSSIFIMINFLLSGHIFTPFYYRYISSFDSSAFLRLFYLPVIRTGHVLACKDLEIFEFEGVRFLRRLLWISRHGNKLRNKINWKTYLILLHMLVVNIVYPLL